MCILAKICGWDLNLLKVIASFRTHSTAKLQYYVITYMHLFSYLLKMCVFLDINQE